MGIKACSIALDIASEGVGALGVVGIIVDWSMVMSSASALLHDLSTVGGTIDVHPKNLSVSASIAMPSPGVTPLNINLNWVGTPILNSNLVWAVPFQRIAPVMSATNA